MLLCASDEVDLSTRLQQCPDAQLPEEILAIKCKKSIVNTLLQLFYAFESNHCSLNCDGLNITFTIQPYTSWMYTLSTACSFHTHPPKYCMHLKNACI